MRPFRSWLAASAAGAWLWAAAPQTQRSVLDGAFTADQAKRGEAISQKECANCHGSDLSGGEEAPALEGGAFLANWTGLTVGDLYDRIRTTMPQDNPARLTRQQDADVIAYILNLNRFPAGKAELPTQSEVLKQIKIDAPK